MVLRETWQLRDISRSLIPHSNFNRRISLILRNDNLLFGMNHLQSDSMPMCCPAPLLRGWPIWSERVAYFAPKGRPVCSERVAFLLRNTHLLVKHAWTISIALLRSQICLNCSPILPLSFSSLRPTIKSFTYWKFIPMVRKQGISWSGGTLLRKYSSTNKGSIAVINALRLRYLYFGISTTSIYWYSIPLQAGFPISKITTRLFGFANGITQNTWETKNGSQKPWYQEIRLELCGFKMVH